jgi:glycosyltransferase involved in cell wall biosynthesis
MNTIHISIQAYNAEETLRRAIDSVLAQTYKNFVIYVCDDASIDSTPDIIRDYEKRGLIKAYFNDTNGVYSDSGNEFLDVKNHISDDDFYAQLDADDELYPEFFEKLVTFAVENDLDIAVAGYDIYDLQTNVKNTYQVFLDNKNVIILETSEDYFEKFRFLYNYTWTIWGKLYRGNVCGELVYTIANFGYGHDTVSVLAALRKARRVGILPEQLMVYYVNGNSNVSNRYDNRRIYLPEKTFELLKKLLLEKLHITAVELNFYTDCFDIYFVQIIETLKFTLNTDITTDEKIKEIKYLSGNDIFRDFYRDNDYFKLVSTNQSIVNALYLMLKWIHQNLDKIQPARLRELYHLFFDVIYSAKEPKFLTAEIDYLLQFDIRVINSILCGVFKSPVKLFEKLPESELRTSVLNKVKQYLRSSED